MPRVIAPALLVWVANTDGIWRGQRFRATYEKKIEGEPLELHMIMMAIHSRIRWGSAADAAGDGCA